MMPLPYPYHMIQHNNEIEKGKQKIIWFSPSAPMNVKTNVGKTSLNLLQHHFPKQHSMHKVFTVIQLK